MTTKTSKTYSLLLAVPMFALFFAVVSMPSVFAVDCSGAGAHCHTTVAKTDPDNRGASGTINLNPSNTVYGSSAIVNSLWVNFADAGPGDRDWLEVGWQKGTSMQPCYSSTAKYHTYDAVQSPHAGTCEGSTSGSTATLQVSDYNLDDYWGLKINGSQKDTVYKDEDATWISVGGESTDEDNVLDGGGISSLVIVYTSGTGYSWNGNYLSYGSDASYTNSWNTQYTDFAYEGP